MEKIKQLNTVIFPSLFISSGQVHEHFKGLIWKYIKQLKFTAIINTQGRWCYEDKNSKETYLLDYIIYPSNQCKIIIYIKYINESENFKKHACEKGMEIKKHLNIQKFVLEGIVN